MGGEKLKPSRPFCGILIALFIVASFFCKPFSLYAQAVEQVSETEAEIVQPPVFGTGIDESTIILGEGADIPVPVGESSVFVVIRMVIVLALAALAIYGVVFFIKRLARPQESRDPYLKLLARLPLTNDSYAAVISVGPKAWLIAGGSGGFNLISEIEDNESLETMLLDEARRSSETGISRYFDFRSLLRRQETAQSGNQANSGFAQAGAGSIVDNLRQQRERLRGL